MPGLEKIKGGGNQISSRFSNYHRILTTGPHIDRTKLAIESSHILNSLGLPKHAVISPFFLDTPLDDPSFENQEKKQIKEILAVYHRIAPLPVSSATAENNSGLSWNMCLAESAELIKDGFSRENIYFGNLLLAANIAGSLKIAALLASVTPEALPFILTSAKSTLAFLRQLGFDKLSYKIENTVFQLEDPRSFTNTCRLLYLNMEETDFENVKAKLVRDVISAVDNKANTAAGNNSCEPEHFTFTMEDRTKSPLSFFKKNMQRHEDTIYDRIGFRVIVDTGLEYDNIAIVKSAKEKYLRKEISKEDLENIQSHYNRALKILYEVYCRLKQSAQDNSWDIICDSDYVTNAKTNNYQSLHLAFESIMPNPKDLEHPLIVPFEVQIRTKGMHECAETGSARHLWYKLGYDPFASAACADTPFGKFVSLLDKNKGHIYAFCGNNIESTRCEAKLTRLVPITEKKHIRAYDAVLAHIGENGININQVWILDSNQSEWEKKPADCQISNGNVIFIDSGKRKTKPGNIYDPVGSSEANAVLRKKENTEYLELICEGKNIYYELLEKTKECRYKLVPQKFRQNIRHFDFPLLTAKKMGLESADDLFCSLTSDKVRENDPILSAKPALNSSVITASFNKETGHCCYIIPKNQSAEKELFRRFKENGINYQNCAINTEADVLIITLRQGILQEQFDQLNLDMQQNPLLSGNSDSRIFKSYIFSFEVADNAGKTRIDKIFDRFLAFECEIEKTDIDKTKKTFQIKIRIPVDFKKQIMNLKNKLLKILDDAKTIKYSFSD